MRWVDHCRPTCLRGDTVLIHSSFKSFQGEINSPKEIIDALSDGKINDFKDKKYSNYEVLLSKHETDEIIRKRLLS